MSKRHWEDFRPGAVAVYGPRLVTREEIVAFAAEFDPQPMHLDEAAGPPRCSADLPRLACIRAAS
jgi:acyl dehydratase